MMLFLMGLGLWTIVENKFEEVKSETNLAFEEKK